MVVCLSCCGLAALRAPHSGLDPSIVVMGIVVPRAGDSFGVDVLDEAKRAIAQGQRVTIDFHRGDAWADPAHQAKPAASASHTVARLGVDIHSSSTGSRRPAPTGRGIRWAR